MNNPETTAAAYTTLNLLSASIYGTFAAVKAANSFEKAHAFRVTLWDLMQIYERVSQECHPLVDEINALDERIRVKAQQYSGLAPKR